MNIQNLSKTRAGFEFSDSLYYLCGLVARKIAPVNAPAVPLPASLIVPPGNYSLYGMNYAFEKDGLYRILLPTGESQQRIVHVSDVVALLSAITWINSHGNRDDAADQTRLIEIAMRGKVVCTCGPFSAFVCGVLDTLKIPVRRVGGRTLQEKNGMNDGHILTEVKVDHRWVALEADPGKFYRHRGRRLNLLEFVRQLHRGEYEAEPLSKALPLAVGNFTAEDGGHLDLWYETLGALENSDDALRRAMGIPFIPDDGAYYYTAFSERDRRTAAALWPSPEYRYLSEPEFRARFYPGEDQSQL